MTKIPPEEKKKRVSALANINPNTLKDVTKQPDIYKTKRVTSYEQQQLKDCQDKLQNATNLIDRMNKEKVALLELINSLEEQITGLEFALSQKK